MKCDHRKKVVSFGTEDLKFTCECGEKFEHHPDSFSGAFEQLQIAWKDLWHVVLMELGIR